MITLNALTLNDIIAHCNQEHPIEACGILAGIIRHVHGVLTKKVVQTYPCENELNDATRYKISAKEQYRAFIDIEDRGFDLIGFYHSHPNGSSMPSTIDLEQANYFGYTYLIIALHPIQVTAWIFEANREFIQESLSIV